MRRLTRLDVSLDLAMYLLMVWLLIHGAVPLPFKLGFLHCGSVPLNYISALGESFQGGLCGWSLGLGVLGTAWLETRMELRPWFKRALRLSGQLLVTSILVCMWIFNSDAA